MNRIKIVEPDGDVWPEGTARIVKIFRDRDLQITMEEAAVLESYRCSHSETTWIKLSMTSDEFIFTQYKDYYYIDQ